MGCSDSRSNLPEETARKKVQNELESENKDSITTKNESNDKTPVLNKPIIGSKLVKSPRKSQILDPNIDDLPILNENLVKERLKKSFDKDYEILGVIGSGSYGMVYKINQLNTNIIRALKVVKKEIVSYQDDEKIFLKEIEILCKLDHPNILKIYEFFFDGDSYFIITEFIEGGELLEQIYKIPDYCENKAADIMAQILSAVSYLHSNNIVHRDLKPENIILKIENEDNFLIKIIDFGTANFHNDSRFTAQYGTSYYVAPEILKNDYTSKCDIWSCGVILYVILSGTSPFKGRNDSEILKAVEIGTYTLDIPEFENISLEAKDFMSKLLTYNPSNRPTADECLKHEWIVSNSYEEPIDYKVLFKNLKKFMTTRKLEKSILAYIIHQVSSSDITTKLRATFKQIDKSGDGRLRLNDLKKALESHYIGDQTISTNIDQILNQFKQNNKEYLEYEEFLRMTLDMNLIITEKNLKMAFDHFDEDKTGKLTVDNIRNALGIFYNDEQKERDAAIKILKESNIEGEVNFETFKSLMKNMLK